jgi:hypothetical protein
MGNEKTGEGFQATGQQPDAAAKRPALRDSDPQAYEVFLEELREMAGVEPHIGKTMRDVVDVIKVRASGSQTNADVWLGDLLELILDCDRTDIEDKYGSWLSATTRAARQLAQLKSRPENTAGPNPIAQFIDQLVASSDMSGPSAFDILKVCLELAVFLMDKNRKYGDSAIDPVRIMSSADPVEQIKVRMDDKLSRLYRGHLGGEDAMQDLVGYWVLLRVAEKKADKAPTEA